jgi:hypothetical protein
MTTTKLDIVSVGRRSPAWLRVAFTGIIICGIIGPALPLLVIIPASAFKDTSFFEGLRALEAFPVAWLFALIPMGPPGAVLGALAALWIRFRSRAIGSRRLIFETLSVGMLLGALVPLIALVFGWGDSGIILSGYVPIGAITGAICAFLVYYTLKKRDLLSSRQAG